MPTMTDRARQTVVKYALEPAWEACFAPNRDGFRPGRSCHEAIEASFTAIGHQATSVLDADIEKGIDRIDQTALLAKVNASPRLRRQLKAWLQAGAVDQGTWFPTDAGTRQGSPLSPLLANIATAWRPTSAPGFPAVDAAASSLPTSSCTPMSV